jgi:hypothetical protein
MLKRYRELKSKNKAKVQLSGTSSEVEHYSHDDKTGELLNTQQFFMTTDKLDDMINTLQDEKDKLQDQIDKINDEILDLEDMKTDIEELVP